MSTLKVNNLQVGQDSTATNNLTWFQPGSPDGTIRLGSGNAGSATSKFTFDKDGNLTCAGNINAASILAPIEGTLDDWIIHAGDTNTKFGFPAADTFTVETAGSERLRITSGGDIQVDNGNVHIDDNGEFAIFEQDTARAMTNSSKISMDFSGNVARIRSSHNGSGSNAVSRNLGFYIGSGQKLLITSTEITAAVQLNLESAGSYIKSNQLKFNPSGHAYIDHGVNAKDIYFRLSRSSAMDTTMMQFDSDGEIIKFYKVISVGLQGGNDTAVLAGGAGVGAYLALNHASSGINTKLMGNNDSYLNQFHGDLAIGEDDPDGNKLLIRAASTVGTNKGHIMLTGDSATAGQGPQIVFSESGSGSSYAGAYIGHIREGSNSTGSLVLGTRGTGGDASTVPDERIRIYSTGQILYSAASGDNTITSKRTNSAGSNGNYFFHLKAQASGGTTVGELGFHRDTNTDDSRLVFSTKKTGGGESVKERLRIDSSGRVIVGGDGGHAGGAQFIVKGTSDTLNTYGCAAFCRIGANPTSGQTLTNLRFSGGAGGTNRAAEITVKCDANWSDGSSQASKMEFGVSDSGGTSAGSPSLTLKAGGDVEINRGNLIVANDKGISFIESDDTATGETVSSSVLDDYEEGSWTPDLMDGNGSNVTYSNSTARYVKVGRMVYCYFNVTRAETGSKTGSMRFYNLPYGATNSTLQVTGTWWLDEGSPSQNDAVGGAMYVVQNQRQAYFVYPTNEWQQAGNRYLTFSQWQNGRPIYGSFVYEAYA